jgi:sugar/nucleoside kinase (ribokinase family)
MFSGTDPMTQAPITPAAEFDVTGIGNAIVDVLAEVGDDFLAANGVTKGGMTLVDAPTAASLYAKMPPAIEASGGSLANSIAGLAALGARCGYIGRVKNDQLGGVFSHDIRSLGVTFKTSQAEHGPATATCMILVTPDAQRSMSTYLGACVELGPEEVDPQLIQGAKVTYLEGYLWDPPRAKDAFRTAIKLAKQAGRKVAITLSDAFCVDRYRAEFLELVNGHVDIVFANEAEILSLYQVDTFDAAASLIAKTGVLAALTRSEQGSVVVHGDVRIAVPAAPVVALVDSTGAGDQYAAGFLFGYTRGLSLETCARMGSIAAAEVLDHIGPRPKRPVLDLFKAANLI